MITRVTVSGWVGGRERQRGVKKRGRVEREWRRERSGDGDGDGKRGVGDGVGVGVRVCDRGAVSEFVCVRESSAVQ